ncbi:LOW QUALITY PROTEIN: mesoderm posterior protein 1-like [Trachemys scripta elegans]|uniref:LOW QUALITY PROTEIN: mesoderm posterior protein 1-like n=1 Tax=Trachemys scripta elegans TaxID=31138 RepID=UPI001557AD7A|nr:LOW QUALITY PROTEIN: mesoderm posterior protein 1-like [Trachemys scripta elegans]
MASSPAQLLAPDLLLPPGQALLQEWGRAQPSTEGYSSCSPTPSTDSCGLSPLYPLCPAPQEPCSSCPAAPSLVLTPRRRAGTCPAYGSRKGSRGRAGGGQRQSASEREKLRMRNLSKALHTLRRYLPPSVAPAGQSLTKIETLRLAIRYISHLSELLGLNEETLAQRRGGPRRHCPLCPEGLGCCQARTPGLRAASPAPAGPPPGAGGVGGLAEPAPCLARGPAGSGAGPAPLSLALLCFQLFLFHTVTIRSPQTFTQCTTWGSFPRRWHETAYNMLGFACLFLLPLLIMVSCYSRILLEISRRMGTGLFSKEVALRRSTSNIPRARLRVLKLSLVIVSSFIVCWTPYYLLGLWYWFCPRAMEETVSQSLTHVLFIFGLLNACLDPLTYGLFTIPFRRGLGHCCWGGHGAGPEPCSPATGSSRCSATSLHTKRSTMTTPAHETPGAQSRLGNGTGSVDSSYL